MKMESKFVGDCYKLIVRTNFGLSLFAMQGLNPLSDWESLCWNTCHKILGVDGYAVADFLIKATNTTLSNTAELGRVNAELERVNAELERVNAELERANAELERINSSRGWKLLEKIYSSRGWKLVILLQGFAIQRINPLILLSSYRIKRYFRPKKPKKINLNSKKIVFIGHSYHAKTKSSEFILNYLKEIYDVEVILDESWNGGKPFPDLSFVDDSYLAVIFWQNLPSPEALAEIKNENLLFFPMYDAVGGLDVSWWLQYENLKIISFSETLHKKLERLGLDSMHLQYFPKPENFSPGNKNEVFFWQRRTNVNINTIANIFRKRPRETSHP